MPVFLFETLVTRALSNIRLPQTSVKPHKLHSLVSKSGVLLIQSLELSKQGLEGFIGRWSFSRRWLANLVRYSESTLSFFAFSIIIIIIIIIINNNSQFTFHESGAH